MLKVPLARLQIMDRGYPGLRDGVILREHAPRPACPHCGSADTAEHGGAFTGRALNEAAATTRLKLGPPDAPGDT